MSIEAEKTQTTQSVMKIFSEFDEDGYEKEGCDVASKCKGAF